MRAHYGSTLVLALIVAATGCSKKKLQLLLADDDDLPSTAPSIAAAPPSVAPPPTTATSVPTTTTTTATAAAAGYPATCAGVCEKTLRCMSAYNAQEQKSCVDSCQAGRPDPAKFARMVKMDCKTLIGAVNGGGGGGASPSGPCNQCNTCVWDGTSCYSRVPPFLACDACCCRKGGPAPRWD